MEENDKTDETDSSKAGKFEIQIHKRIDKFEILLIKLRILRKTYYLKNLKLFSLDILLKSR